MSTDKCCCQINGIGQLTAAKQRRASFIRMIAEWQELGARFLLGYNEPDDDGCNGCHHPHIASPAAAASDWITLQALADQHSLTLVSPAMSTAGIDDSGQSVWLDSFFAECDKLAGCDSTKIRYIAFHDYTGDVQRVIGRAEGLLRRYGRRTWLTEFAINTWGCTKPGCVGSQYQCHCDPPTRAQQDAYMRRVLPALEACDAVYRYAWYTARDQPSTENGGGNLLDLQSPVPRPTSTGEIYREHALAMQAHDADARNGH
jgi:hypothetical protein